MVDSGKYFEISEGNGRERVYLSCQYMGKDIIVRIYNERAHIGAVAVAEYDHTTKRASTSLISLLGHKDDSVAMQAAHDICKHTERPACVIAGIHLDDITGSEIRQIVSNCSAAVDKLINNITGEGK